MENGANSPVEDTPPTTTSSSSSKPLSNIKVVIRVRPSDDGKTWSYTPHSITQLAHNLNGIVPVTTFNYDRVYAPEVTETAAIFNDCVEEIVEGAAVDGINGTVFAYGQTSAGKTFTMQGHDQNPGIIPLGLRSFFARIAKYNGEVIVKMSYLEVYNEVIGDLLNKESRNLKIHETADRGVFVGGVCEERVNSFEAAMELVCRGEEVRKIGRTNLNEYSSRSHTILQLHVQVKRSNGCDPTITRSSILTFVDLAGSERSGQMGNDGQRLKEGGHINKSLMSLATVISRLAELSSEQGFVNSNHIPYRDSKLTRLLQPALTGNSRCVIICAVSPSSKFLEETLSTLKFASRAKAIKAKSLASTNEIIADEDVIKCYREQVDCLRGELGTVQKRAMEYADDLRQVKRMRVSEREALEGLCERVITQATVLRQFIDESTFVFKHIQADHLTGLSALKMTVAEQLDDNRKDMLFLQYEKVEMKKSLDLKIAELEQTIESLDKERTNLNGQLDELQVKVQHLRAISK